MTAQQEDFRGNAGAFLGTLLTDLGLVDSRSREQIESLLLEELTARGLDATVASVRYNIATLHADPHNAALLSYDLDIIKGNVNTRAIAAQVPALEEIVVRTRSSWRETK